MKEIVNREITPLKESDSFLVFDRKKCGFTYPLHFHPEYELNFIRNAQGARRIVGDSIETINDYELTLIGPNLYHVWEDGDCEKTREVHEVTIQFMPDIFAPALLRKNIFRPISEMFLNTKRGILFSVETARQFEYQITSLSRKDGFVSFVELQSLLYNLSISRGQRLLANSSFQTETNTYSDERIERLHKYIKENYNRKLMLKDAADLLNMSTISFTRLIKQRTGKSFVDFLNEIRLGYATRMLIDSDKSISEICFECGFNNISNFNRIFKKKQKQTPSLFRETFSGIRNVY